MEIKRIAAENAAELRLKNEPFSMPGRFVPALRDGVWTWREEPFAQAQTDCFPDENYDLAAVDAAGAAFGAYENGVCVGLAVYEDAFFKYWYLSDLKVCAAARGRGVGTALIRAGLAEAKGRGCRGLYAVAQDNNLLACRFYLRAGFRVGGFDNRVYGGTAQADKANVIFYLDGEDGT